MKISNFCSQLLVLMLFVTQNVSAQSFAKAEVLLDNGLTTEAQKELIDLVFSQGNSPDKPKALNLLASIAVDKNNIKAALDAWGRLIKTFPNAPEALVAKKRMSLLASVFGQSSDELISDASARALLRNADFWAKDRDKIFRIDTSWIPKIDAAIYWYDKVILEFQGTAAAKTAYEEKMRTLLGWKDSGQYGQSHGVKDSPTRYIPILEETFRDYERAFPQSSSLQAFRFQLAQVFWSSKNWTKTREFLNEIVEKDKDENSFYKDLAERRLKKVEF